MKVWLDKLRALYSGPAIGLVATLAILSSFMWLWSRAGYKEGEFGINVVSAFSSLAIALAALWAGQGFRKRQEESAHARAMLALNVELITRVLPHEDLVALEVEVRVKNVSNKTWNLPMVYVFVQPIDSLASSRGAFNDGEIIAPEVWTLRGRNIARFSNAMTRLSPDEEEVFSKAYLLDRESVKRAPYRLVLVEAVGAPDSEELDKKARNSFDDFMDGKIRDGKIDPEAPAEREPVRDTYMVIETTDKALRKKGSYGRRVLITPPDKPRSSEDEQADRIDLFSSNEDLIKMLDNTMIWSRKGIVCVGQAMPNKAEANDGRVGAA